MARPAASRPGLPAVSRKLAIGLGVAGVVLVAGVGMLGMLGAPAGAHTAGGMFAATPAPVASAAAASLSDTWGGGAIGIDPLDVTFKAVLVVILLFVTLRILARVQGAGRSRKGNLTVLESTTLAPKASLHLVAVGDRRLVVGLTPAGMVALTELDAAELPVPEPATSAAATGAAPQRPVSLAPGRLNDLIGPAVRPVDRFGALLAGIARANARRAEVRR